MGSFKFNGISTEDLGLVIQTPPSYTFPERDVTTYHVPGRNGDLFVDNNCYKNTERVYSIAKGFRNNTTYYQNMQQVLSWLTSCNGTYCRLEDSYDNEVYRLATFVMGSSFSNIHDKASAINITFNCKPQRYLLAGEETYSYTGDEILITNPSRYEALPKIEIKNVPNEQGKVTMMTEYDENDKVLSSVSITRVAGQTGSGTMNIVLDSEYQTATDLDENNISDSVGLNGKEFPVLCGSKNKFNFKKFINENETIKSYNQMIVDHQSVCISKYDDYETLEAGKRESRFFISFDNLVDRKMESYQASSVYKLLDDKSETYVIQAFDSLLKQNAKQTVLTRGTLSDNSGAIESNPDLSLTEVIHADGTTTITVKAIKNTFILRSDDAQIRFITANTTILERSSTDTSTFTIYGYPTDESGTKLGVNYLLLDDWPEWLLPEIQYDDKNSPTSVKFKLNKDGYLWTDKTWIFGKAKWQYSYTGLELNSFVWNNSKKAFIVQTGLTSSTTATFTYKYIKELPQYEDIEIGDNDVIKAYFDIVDVSPDQDLSIIRVDLKNDPDLIDSYVSYSLNEAGSDKKSKWKHIIRAEDRTFIYDLKGTSSFEVYYIKSIPEYEAEGDNDKWPEWINPYPSFTENPMTISDKSKNIINFEVLLDGYYRYSYIGADGKEKNTEWEYLDAGSILETKKTVKDNYTIYYIEEIPEEYEHDRSFNDSADIPYYLDVEYIDGEDTKEDERKVIYKAATYGYYKWDTNSAWVYRNAGESLLQTEYKDDTTIYFMEEIPQYIDYYMIDLIRITPKTDTGGNPNEVRYEIIEPGYYRVNANSDWTYYNEDDLLLVSKVGDTNKIYHLKDTNEKLTSIVFNIIPRWWML